MYGLSLKLNLFRHLSVKTFFLLIIIFRLFIQFKRSCCSRYVGRINPRLDARIKHVPTKIHNFTSGLKDNLENTYVSSVAKYLINNGDCAENFSVDLFTILSKSHSSFYLWALEAVHILSGRPSLPKQREYMQGLKIISILSPIQEFFLYLKYFIYFYTIFSILALLSEERNWSDNFFFLF